MRNKDSGSVKARKQIRPTNREAPIAMHIQPAQSQRRRHCVSIAVSITFQTRALDS